MDSLFWTNSNLKHKIRESNRLFYGEYRYCASGGLDYAKLLRGFDRDTLSYRIKMHRSMNRTDFGYFFYSYNHDRNRKAITHQTEKCLYNFLDLVENIQTDYKLVFGWHDFYFYTNDVDSVKDVLCADGVYAKPVVETVITHPAKTIVRKRSDYQYRCYLSNSVLTQSQHDRLTKFFNNHCESTRLSKTFREWLDKDYKYCRDYFFFDYNDAGLPLLLEMIVPGIVKENLKIIIQD